MPQSDMVKSLTEQPDLSHVKLINERPTLQVYQAIQTFEGEQKKQLIRVNKDIHNHFASQREKDLLHYLNQFEEDFPRFNEIRKQGFAYLTFFDYVGKKTLKQKVKKSGALSLKKAKHFLANMISTLEHAHNVGFVHTQLNPENIIVGKNRFYLVGWNNAIPSLSSFESELLLGDQQYCPPERLNGEYGDAGDIYNLGCTLYFALTGKHIYRLNKVEHLFDQLYAHAFHTPRKLNSLPIFWRQLIVWMTQKDPEKRPGLVELKQWLLDESVPKSIREQSLMPCKKFPQDSLTALADSHFLYALFKKASLYESSGDTERAFNLYESCAFREYTRAENNLGLMYEKGLVIHQSYLKAMNMYHHAFKKGNPFAAYNLARLFENGLGAEQNLLQAFKLYQFSAKRGHLAAQNKLGELYMAGKGVNKDVVQARFWFGMAAHYGNPEARLNIKKLLGGFA
ncbi:Sel1-like repeat-containing protein kinase family protein [Hydrogenovibrio sp. 3SP14C1]|uniref:Sel1-like repeat-containing protein kinase family protein n=1 Tax=Hydrogenovibrio sp. 3SP14C1 TaxID=3038774 RepID=UPI00241738BA|nr:Sel1-like repeat-containing protein kinase family protein [Hydrogenovibrio sp. 3SP14C1]MDG4813594.1 Sel1-like repeat-containing protein kinase family protein [Hydrogenovibrio sp. 3SP14C1]